MEEYLDKILVKITRLSRRSAEAAHPMDNMGPAQIKLMVPRMLAVQA